MDFSDLRSITRMLRNFAMQENLMNMSRQKSMDIIGAQDAMWRRRSSESYSQELALLKQELANKLDASPDLERLSFEYNRAMRQGLTNEAAQIAKKRDDIAKRVASVVYKTQKPELIDVEDLAALAKQTSEETFRKHVAEHGLVARQEENLTRNVEPRLKLDRDRLKQQVARFNAAQNKLKPGEEGVDTDAYADIVDMYNDMISSLNDERKSARPEQIEGIDNELASLRQEQRSFIKSALSSRGRGAPMPEPTPTPEPPASYRVPFTDTTVGAEPQPQGNEEYILAIARRVISLARAQGKRVPTLEEAISLARGAVGATSTTQ